MDIMQHKLNSLFIVFIVFLISCKPTTNKLTQPADSSFKKTLIKKQIPGLKYFISLPANYVIKEKRGPDFSVYYFYPADTTNKTSFYGGFYLGNFPAGSSADETCKEQNIKANLLGEAKNWTLYNCNHKYRIQIITAIKSGYNWAQYIHAFGTGLSKPELNKLLDVYSTLKSNK